MYVLPKGLESAWTAARGHGWVFKTGNYGESIVSDELGAIFSCFMAYAINFIAYSDRDGYGHGMFIST